MSEMMNALVTYAPFDYRYEKYPMPQIGRGEILLKVKGCGICAGDIKAYHGGIRVWGTSEENRYIETPCIGGHEFYGEIVSLADDVSGFEIGDRIVAEQIVPCNACEFCRQEKYWMCQRSAVFGFKRYANGGFAEYVKLPADSLKHKVPQSFTEEECVLIEPIACGMHAVEQAGIRHTDVVVIAGLGAIGLSMVNLVGLMMPRMVIGVDIQQERLDLGKLYGADLLLNPLECNVAEEIKAVTNGLGCDVYFEVSGSGSSVTQGMEALRNMGRYVQMGVFSEEVKADWNIIGDGKELLIKGSHLSGKTYPAVIHGIERGYIKTEGLISHTFKLKNWKEAFELTERGGSAMKVMLKP